MNSMIGNRKKGSKRRIKSKRGHIGQELMNGLWVMWQDTDDGLCFGSVVNEMVCSVIGFEYNMMPQLLTKINLQKYISELQYPITSISKL